MVNLISLGYDFNSKNCAITAFNTIQNIIDNRSTCHHLLLSGGKFSTSQKVGNFPGWYIIIKEKFPVYVGQSKNLEERITGQGSIDGYYLGSFTKRNSIKQMINFGFKLNIIIIPETYVYSDLSIVAQNDSLRCHFECFIDVYRGFFSYDDALKRVI